MTYDIFKDKPISHKIDLVELHLKKECTGWAAEGGAYKCTFNDAIDNAPIDIDSVEGDGTALTEAASIAEVQNNPDRWFQDAANNLLYVSFTGGAEADTKTVIAIFKVYFATEGYIANSEPEILTDGGLEDWASATDLTSWAESITGTSTINRDNANQRSGTYCARFDIDAGNSLAYIYQNNNLKAFTQYIFEVCYKTASAKSCGYELQNMSNSKYLQADGSWSTDYYNFSLTNTSWTKAVKTFISDTAANYRILIKRASAASSSFYIDDISLKKYVPNYYLPRIPEDGVRLDCSSDYVDSGSLTLLNGDGLFDTKLGDWIWRGCSCTVKRGGDNLTYAQYEAMGDFLITSLDYNSNEIALNLKGIKLNWNKRLPLNEFYTAEEILKPESNGTYTGWAAEGGAAWQCVADEVESRYGDKFGTYIKLTSGSAKASFNLPASAIPAGAVINFVTLYVVGGVALNETHEMKLLIKSGAAESTKSFYDHWAHSNSWCEKVHSWATNPADGEAWDKADIDALEVGVEGDTKGVENQICYVTRIYLKVNYSVMKTFDEGKFLPILYGAISSNKEATFTPVLIDDTVEKGKFGLADKSVQRIKSVDAVKYEGELLTPGTHYTVDEINCTILMKTAYPKTIDDPSALKVYLKGAQINDIPGESSIEHIISASHILRHLFSRVLEWDIAKIDDSSFDTAATDAPQECRLFITDETYAADIIALICQSVRGVFSQDRDGKLYFNIWNEDDTGALELQDEDILALNINERNIMPAYRVVVKYGRDPDSGDWLLEKAEDISAKYKFKQVETKTFETLLVNKSDAHDLAYELLDAYREPIKEIEVLVKLQASKLKVGDKIKITRSRAPNSDGNWSAETFQVKTVTKEGGFKTRLTLEPNKYLSASTVSTDEKMEYDDKEAIMKATSLITSSFEIKSDKKVQGKTNDMGTTVDKVDGAIENTTHLIKTDKVIATSIQLDEVLRKSSIHFIHIEANCAGAIYHGLSNPPEYRVSMYSSGGGMVYSGIGPITVLDHYTAGWKITTVSTGADQSHLGVDGDMEVDNTDAWTAVQSTLAKVTTPVHGGVRALKVTIGAGETIGYAYQDINITPAGIAGWPGVCDFRGWLRNGNATNCRIYWYCWLVDEWILIEQPPIVTGTTEYVERTSLRMPVPAGTTKLRIQMRVDGEPEQVAYFDDLACTNVVSGVVIFNKGGPHKDWKIRVYIEEAGT